MSALTVGATLRDKIAFVVLSCDKYADLWEPCFQRLKTYWPGMPLDLYVVANRCEFGRYDVITLLSGEDLDWSSTVRCTVSQLPHPYVFFWFEDAFLDAPINESEILRCFNWALATDADYLRLRDVPQPGQRVAGNIGRLVEGKPYRNTCFAALWKREVFLGLLRDGESAADFEMNGTGRSDAHDRFYGVYRRQFAYLHGVVRGRWLPSVLRKLVASGDVKSISRPVMSARQERMWRVGELKGTIVTRLPSGWAEHLFTIKRVLRGRGR